MRNSGTARSFTRRPFLALVLSAIAPAAAAPSEYGVAGLLDSAGASPARGTIPSGAGPNGPPSISASDFVAHVHNPYFPLLPGTTFRYRGTKDGQPTVDVYRVTNQIRRILGVP